MTLAGVTPSPAAPSHPQSGDVVAKNMLSTAVGNLFPPLSMLVTAPVLAQALGVDDRGAVAAATAPLLLITVAATFGVPQAVTYAIARSPGLLGRATRQGSLIIGLASLLATAGVILAAGPLSGDNSSIAKLMIIASVAILPTLLIAVLRGSASGLHMWKEVAQERFLSAASRLLGLVPLAFFHVLTPLTATIVLSAGPLLGAIPYWRLRKVSAAQIEAAEKDLTGSRYMLSYGMRSWVGALSGIVLSRLDQTVMTPLAGAAQLGMYAVAANISEIPLIISGAVRDVTFSSDASHTVNARIGAAARISSTVAAALGLVVGLTMPFWLPWLFGHDFEGAVPVTAVLIVAIVLGTPGSIAGAALGARGRPGLRSWALIIACVVNVGLLFWFVPKYGAMGGALATLIGNQISANLCIVFMWRVFGVSPREFYGFRKSDAAIIRRFVLRTLTSLRPGRNAKARPAAPSHLPAAPESGIGTVGDWEASEVALPKAALPSSAAEVRTPREEHLPD